MSKALLEFTKKRYHLVGLVLLIVIFAAALISGTSYFSHLPKFDGEVKGFIAEILSPFGLAIGLYSLYKYYQLPYLVQFDCENGVVYINKKISDPPMKVFATEHKPKVVSLLIKRGDDVIVKSYKIYKSNIPLSDIEQTFTNLDIILKHKAK
ncbi:hypothetical protein [Glaciecola sp. SC05]|uniref:hypothetical protein n=1 Tax=Glaciecola sp. SC05 TaxID=1987355 RepID=UPI0035270954